MQTEDKERVRKNTSGRLNRAIDKRTFRNIAFFSKQPAAVQDAHMEKLEKEWDIERVLELNAALLSFGGVLFSGLRKRRRWLFLPGVVTSFLVQHALQGWCPPIPLLRRLGFRTRAEIDQEKYTLKALRENSNGSQNLRKAWAEVRSDRVRSHGPIRRRERAHY
jgi:hypothetical protein